MRAPFCATKRLGSRYLVSCAVVHEQPRHAVKNIAECLDRLRGDVHEATFGGPRGSAPGCKVSMQTIRPRRQCGHSHSDTPVSR